MVQIEKEVKLSQFADDVILHLRDPKYATRKLLDNNFSKMAGHKVNLQNQ